MADTTAARTDTADVLAPLAPTLVLAVALIVAPHATIDIVRHVWDAIVAGAADLVRAIADMVTASVREVTGMMFNPAAPLDTTQIDDLRPHDAAHTTIRTLIATVAGLVR